MKIDLGCGNNKEVDWFGIDKIKTASTDLVWDLETGTLPYKDNSIEKIRLIEVIEHIKNYESLISETFRILKKDGEILITTPDKDCIVNKLFHSYERPVNEHIHLFRQIELERLLKQVGFKITESYKTPYKRWIGKLAWFRKRFINENIIIKAIK